MKSKVSQYADVEPSCVVRAVAYFLEPAVWSVCLSLVCSGELRVAEPRNNPKGRAGATW